MPITDNKTFGWNINVKQFLGLLAVAVIVVVAIATDSLVIGYILMTLVLCAFFLIVAYDIGLKRPDSHAGAVDEGAEAGRSAR